MPNYSELKEKAKELGIEYFGIAKKDLEKLVNEKLAETGEPELPEETPEEEAEDTVEESTPEETPKTLEENEVAPVEEVIPDDKTTEENKEETPEEEAEKPKPNAAIVLQNNYEVRRYTQDTHGDKFIALAKEFAAKFSHEIKLIVQEAPQYCKNCGSILE